MKSHLAAFIGIFIMHIMDDIHCIYIYGSNFFDRCKIFTFHGFIIQNTFRFAFFKAFYYKVSANFVIASVNSV
mgnify:CR=1 FL=1